MDYRYYHHPGDHNTGPVTVFRTRTYELIHFRRKDQWALFDFLNDPLERRNVSGQPGQDEVTAELNGELLRLHAAVRGRGPVHRRSAAEWRGRLRRMPGSRFVRCGGERSHEA